MTLQVEFRHEHPSADALGELAREENDLLLVERQVVPGSEGFAVVAFENSRQVRVLPRDMLLARLPQGR